MNELISVIIPVYNTSKYLSTCLNSVINQTYTNIEIIIINDGSIDNSDLIIKSFLFDSRIIYYQQKNEGLSSARNKGIELSNGNYIMFVDSDDYLSPNIVCKLYELCHQSNCPIAMCDYQSLSRNILSKEYDICLDSFKIMKIEPLMITSLFTVSWGKLYKKDLFEEIKFPYGRINEDAFTTYKLFYKARKFALTTQKLYFYNENNVSSITYCSFSKKNYDKIISRIERLEYLKTNDYTDALKNMYLSIIKLCIKYYYRYITINEIKLSHNLRRYILTFSYEMLMLSRKLPKEYIIFNFSSFLYGFIYKEKVIDYCKKIKI